MAAVGRSGGGRLGGQTHRFGGIRAGQTTCQGVSPAGRGSVSARVKPGAGLCQLGPATRRVPPRTPTRDPAVGVESRRPEVTRGGT